jgi:hypothetical protein
VDLAVGRLEVEMMMVKVMQNEAGLVGGMREVVTAYL